MLFDGRRPDAGRRQRLSGSQLSVHQVAASPAEQVDAAVRRQRQRSVGGSLSGSSVSCELIGVGREKEEKTESEVKEVIIG